MIPSDPRHGHVAGYRAGCQQACCRRAIATYNKRIRLRQLRGQPASDLTPIGGTRLRIQALVALGWSFPRLEAHTGYDKVFLRKLTGTTQARVAGKTAARIAAAYDDLSMVLPPNTTRADRQSVTRSRNHAHEHGWLPPLALDDDLLDTPGYQPTRPRKHTGLGNQLLDHAVVERVLAGQRRPRKLTYAPAAEIYRRLRARGHSTTEIEHTYGINSKRYTTHPEGDTAA